MKCETLQNKMQVMIASSIINHNTKIIIVQEKENLKKQRERDFLVSTKSIQILEIFPKNELKSRPNNR